MLVGISRYGRSNTHRSNNNISTADSDCSPPHPLFSSISVKHDFHIDRPPASKPTAMSAPASSEPALKSLQKRLKSLHDRRYNLDAHFLSIRQETEKKLACYAFKSRAVVEGRLALYDPINSWRFWPYQRQFNPQEINRAISGFRSDIKEMERWMCRTMRAFKELRKNGEYE